MTDIDVLLRYFVEEKIINTEEEQNLISCVTKPEKVRKFLLNILGPLESGNESGFDVMLKIMKEHGTVATQDLAKAMESRISSFDKYDLPDKS